MVETRRAEGQRDGFALAATVLALILVGVLVTGGFYASTQESRIANSLTMANEALQVAEFGVHEALDDITTGEYEAVTIGETKVNRTIDVGDRGRATVTVTRLADRLFLLSSTGEVIVHGKTLASRTLGVLVRTVTLELETDRAMQLFGALSVGGNARVVGTDVTPPTMGNTETCPPNKGDQAGVVARDESLVTYKKKNAITGSPPVREDPSLIDPDKFLQYGDLDYDGLAARASKVLPAGIGPINDTYPSTRADGSCNTADPRNWGAPLSASHPCHTYFPIIHAKGDLKINANASGQGILLVDGDLEMMGGYTFHGIIIVRGALHTGAGNARIYGTTIVFGNGSLGLESESAMTGTPIVNFSTCAIDRAIRYNADLAAHPVQERSWIDLSSAGVDI